jgi:hypothetical protein
MKECALTGCDVGKSFRQDVVLESKNGNYTL